jgi:hypothetical protein
MLVAREALRTAANIVEAAARAKGPQLKRHDVRR